MEIAAINKKKTDKGKAFFIVCFIFLPILNFLIFYVYVNFDAFFMSFKQVRLGQEQWTTGNYTRFFKELKSGTSELSIAFKNTFITFGINLVIFPWGLIVSYFLYKKIWLSSTLRVFFSLPMIISAVVISTIYIEMLSVTGPVAKLLKNVLNLDYTPDILAETRFANYGIWFHLLWLAFPGDLIIWGGTFARIPDSVIEAGKLDGASWVRELVSIIIPIIWPTFMLKYILLFAGIFGSSGNVFLLTGGEWGTQTFSNWMYVQVYRNTSGNNFNVFSYMSAVGLATTVVAAAIAFTVRKIGNTLFQEVEY